MRGAFDAARSSLQQPSRVTQALEQGLQARWHVLFNSGHGMAAMALEVRSRGRLMCGGTLAAATCAARPDGSLVLGAGPGPARCQAVFSAAPSRSLLRLTPLENGKPAPAHLLRLGPFGLDLLRGRGRMEGPDDVAAAESASPPLFVAGQDAGVFIWKQPEVSSAPGAAPAFQPSQDADEGRDEQIDEQTREQLRGWGYWK
jgi:hypothetical protein